MIYAIHELRGTEPDWEAIGKRDLGFTVGLLKSLGKQTKDTVEGAAILVHGVLVKLPVELVLGIAHLVKDPKGTIESTAENVENIIAEIQALPAYVEHAPDCFKAYLDNINSLEDPYEQGEAIGKLVGNVLPTAIVAGSLGKVGKTVKWLNKVGRGVKGMRRGVGRATKTAKVGRRVEQILNDKIIGKQLGNNPAIHTLSESEAQQVIKKLIKAGAKKAKPPIDYPGTWYQFPNGKGFGVRVTNSAESLKHGTKNCVDLDQLNVGIKKLKF